jgi:hypothetical protein
MGARVKSKAGSMKRKPTEKTKNTTGSPDMSSIWTACTKELPKSEWVTFEGSPVVGSVGIAKGRFRLPKLCGRRCGSDGDIEEGNGAMDAGVEDDEDDEDGAGGGTGKRSIWATRPLISMSLKSHYQLRAKTIREM